VPSFALCPSAAEMFSTRTLKVTVLALLFAPPANACDACAQITVASIKAAPMKNLLLRMTVVLLKIHVSAAPVPFGTNAVRGRATTREFRRRVRLFLKRLGSSLKRGGRYRFA